MHICHITEYCHANALAGTERYILELCKELSKMGFTSSIGWLCDRDKVESFVADEVKIFPIKAPITRIDLPEDDFEKKFEQRLAAEIRPDILHFHTFGMAEAIIADVGLRAKIPLVFTYHSPAWTCRRGTLLKWGQNPCDGEVRTLRCSACKLNERIGGLPLMNYALATIGYCFNLNIMGKAGRGKIRRRFAFVKDTKIFREALRNFLKTCSLVISCCDWGIPVLKLNGAKDHSIFLCPQGVSEEFSAFKEKNRKQELRKNKAQFVVGFIGRTTPDKGIHILIDGFRRTSHPDMKLRIFGWRSGKFIRNYAAMIRKSAEEDPRIEIRPMIPLVKLLGEYQELSLVAIPSVWMETGPLVLFEALQLEIPVLGSSRVGQGTLLKHHGKVVEPNTPKEWHKALEQAYQLYKKGKLMDDFGKGKKKVPVRTLQVVSAEMAERYRELVSTPNNSKSC